MVLVAVFRKLLALSCCTSAAVVPVNAHLHRHTATQPHKEMHSHVNKYTKSARAHGHKRALAIARMESIGRRAVKRHSLSQTRTLSFSLPNRTHSPARMRAPLVLRAFRV